MMALGTRNATEAFPTAQFKKKPIRISHECGKSRFNPEILRQLGQYLRRRQTEEEGEESDVQQAEQGQEKSCPKEKGEGSYEEETCQEEGGQQASQEKDLKEVSGEEIDQKENR